MRLACIVFSHSNILTENKWWIKDTVSTKCSTRCCKPSICKDEVLVDSGLVHVLENEKVTKICKKQLL